MINLFCPKKFSNKYIEVVLCQPENPSAQIVLHFQLYDKAISNKYYAAIEEMEKKNVALINPERFYHFPGCHKNKKWVSNKINECIEVINQFKNNAIPMTVEEEISQDTLNKLHHYFEVYRGAVLNPGELYKQAPDHVKDAINDYNLLIHRYESLCLMESIWEKYQVICPQGVFCYEDEKRVRYPLEYTDFKEFTYDNIFGSIVLNYCELGKPILDAFNDRDTHVGDENIRPLKYYSGDTMMKFSPTTKRGFLSRIYRNFVRPHPKGLKEWWKENYWRVENSTSNINDPHNALGTIILGELDRDHKDIKGLSDTEIIELISKYQYFYSVRACSR